MLLFTAVGAAATERFFDQTAPSIVLSCASFGTGMAIYHARSTTKAAFLAPTFGALGTLFLMLAFRTSSASALLLALTVVAFVASVIMAIAGVPNGRRPSL